MEIVLCCAWNDHKYRTKSKTWSKDLCHNKAMLGRSVTLCIKIEKRGNIGKMWNFFCSHNWYSPLNDPYFIIYIQLYLYYCWESFVLRDDIHLMTDACVWWVYCWKDLRKLPVCVVCRPKSIILLLDLHFIYHYHHH